MSHHDVVVILINYISFRFSVKKFDLIRVVANIIHKMLVFINLWWCFVTFHSSLKYIVYE